MSRRFYAFQVLELCYLLCLGVLVIGKLSSFNLDTGTLIKLRLNEKDKCLSDALICGWYLVYSSCYDLERTSTWLGQCDNPSEKPAGGTASFVATVVLLMFWWTAVVHPARSIQKLIEHWHVLVRSTRAVQKLSRYFFLENKLWPVSLLWWGGVGDSNVNVLIFPRP